MEKFVHAQVGPINSAAYQFGHAVAFFAGGNGNAVLLAVATQNQPANGVRDDHFPV